MGNLSSKQIAIVGQGVIGLTTAFRLLDHGYAVTIFSKETLAKTTSMAAGAYWWPHKAYPEEKVAEWARETYEAYVKYSTIPESGVHFEKHHRFCLDKDESTYVLNLVDGWEKINGADYGVPCKEAYLLTVPVIDVPVYMPYLKRLIETKGGMFHIKTLASPEILLPDFDLVINCTGVGAYHFVNDNEVFPIRGQSVVVSLPKGIKHSVRLYQKKNNFALVLSRTHDVVLGGTAHEGSWDRSSRPEETDQILKRCTELIPQIANSQVLGTTVGLRPGRKEVRLELENVSPQKAIIHNYGHGGSGFTVGWGCANEVLMLTNTYFS